MLAIYPLPAGNYLIVMFRVYALSMLVGVQRVQGSVHIRVLRLSFVTIPCDGLPFRAAVSGRYNVRCDGGRGND